MFEEWRSSKIFPYTLTIIIIILMAVSGYMGIYIGAQVFPRVEYYPVAKYVYYDPTNATLILSGGSAECPITFKDVYKALETFGIVSSKNMTIILKGVIADE